MNERNNLFHNRHDSIIFIIFLLSQVLRGVKEKEDRLGQEAFLGQKVVILRIPTLTRTVVLLLPMILKINVIKTIVVYLQIRFVMSRQLAMIRNNLY